MPQLIFLVILWAGFVQAKDMPYSPPARSDYPIRVLWGDTHVHVARDPVGANLDRIQVIKGWRTASGKLLEKVYNVAWSGDRALDVAGKLQSVGSTVDVESASYVNSIGSPELSVVWRDPDFNADEHAFYYVRVLGTRTGNTDTSLDRHMMQNFFGWKIFLTMFLW